MTGISTDVLRYWRSSLADGALGEGKFIQAGHRRCVDVLGKALKTGVLPREALDRVFKDQTSARTVAIRFWPLVMARKLSHGAARGGDRPGARIRSNRSTLPGPGITSSSKMMRMRRFEGWTGDTAGSVMPQAMPKRR